MKTYGAANLYLEDFGVFSSKLVDASSSSLPSKMFCYELNN